MLIDSKKTNAVIFSICAMTSPIEFSVLISSINKDDKSLKLGGGELTQILQELKRLKVVSETNSGYFIPEPIKKLVYSIPREFSESPYEYFLDEERKEHEAESQHKWYMRADAKQRFDDYPVTKKQRNIAILISIISIFVSIVLGVLQRKCS